MFRGSMKHVLCVPYIKARDSYCV